jgi:putative spermidine/putrescine transport system ATP-binding protein
VVDGSRRIPVSRSGEVGAGIRHGEAAAVVVRPERVHIRSAAGKPGAATNGVSCSGVLREIIYVGATRKYVVDLGDGRTAVARVQAGQETDLRPGSAVEVGWDVNHGVVVPDDRGADAPDPGAPEGSATR